jgi:hypothetical protein
VPLDNQASESTSMQTPSPPCLFLVALLKVVLGLECTSEYSEWLC